MKKLVLSLSLSFVLCLANEIGTLKLDKDSGLYYRDVPCKEVIDGHRFFDKDLAFCKHNPTLKEYAINLPLQEAYKEFIAKVMTDTKAFKAPLPTQNLQYEYDNLDIYSDTITITYHIVNPKFITLSIGYENGVTTYSLRQIEPTQTRIEVREFYFNEGF